MFANYKSSENRIRRFLKPVRILEALPHIIHDVCRKANSYVKIKRCYLRSLILTSVFYLPCF
ncbi:hypothetical protein DYQ05_05675 [Treponema pedis]|nr:hypothetical protein DYQ05_05675 [Treponema pedis]